MVHFFSQGGYSDPLYFIEEKDERDLREGGNFCGKLAQMLGKRDLELRQSDSRTYVLLALLSSFFLHLELSPEQTMQHVNPPCPGT